MVGKVDFGGGDGGSDCGFLSIAAALIAHLRQISQDQQWPAVDELFATYAKYYPTYLSQDQATEPKRAFKHLIQTLDPTQFVKSLAYVLRQYAVDQIVADPARYRGPFVANNEGTSPAKMRKREMIDETAIAAIAHAIQIPIKVKAETFEMNYEKNEGDAKGLTIELNVGQAHYTAEVAEPAYFQQYQPTSEVVYVAPQIVDHRDPSLDEILKQIEAQDMRDIQREIDAQTLLKKHSITDLIYLYQKKMPDNVDYLAVKFAKYIPEQYRNDVLAFLSNQHGGFVSQHSDDIRQVIIETLAKQAVIEDKFFKQMQDPNYRSSARQMTNCRASFNFHANCRTEVEKPAQEIAVIRPTISA